MLPASESPLLAGATARDDADVVADAASMDGPGASDDTMLELLELPFTFADGGAGGGGGVVGLVFAVAVLAVDPPAVTPGACAVALTEGAMVLTGLGGLTADAEAVVLLLARLEVVGL